MATKQEESAPSIYEALLQAQAKFPEIAKDKTNEFKNYKYATLDAITNACWPVLHEFGLLPFWETRQQDGRLEVTFFLRQVATGEFLSNSLSLESPDAAQEMGARITYLRRYSASPLLAITPDEDDDCADPAPKPPRRSAPASKPAAKGQAKQQQAPPPPPTQPPAAPQGPNLTEPASYEPAVAALLAKQGTADGLFKLLKQLEGSQEPAWQADQPAYGHMLEKAGGYAELQVQQGKWSDAETSDLFKLLGAMRHHTDAANQAKGLF